MKKRRGVVLMMLAALALTTMIGFVKIARAEMDTLQVMFWRGFVAIPLAWLVARNRGGFAIVDKRTFSLRAGFGFGAMFCFFTAAKGMGLADLSLLYKLQPIVVAVAAPLLLGARERPGAGVWLVLVGGIAGCTLMFAPRLDLALGPGLWALGAVVLAGAAHLCVRKLGASDRPAAVVLWFQLTMTVAALAVLLATGQSPLAPTHLWWALVGTGVCATIGQNLMTMAYQADQAARVAAASYVGPLWALLGDVVVFGIVPPGHALAGGAIIVGAGLMLLRRQATPVAAAAD
jgi:drug/metabolite transporter (DMT)-like permease